MGVRFPQDVPSFSSKVVPSLGHPVFFKLCKKVVNMEKQKVSAKEFDKKVEIEAAHLEYMSGMGKEKAYKKAVEIISQRFEQV
jgi:hypothetical protein